MNTQTSFITRSIIHFLQKLDKLLTHQIQKNQQNLENMGVDHVLADTSNYLKWLFILE